MYNRRRAYTLTQKSGWLTRRRRGLLAGEVLVAQTAVVGAEGDGAHRLGVGRLVADLVAAARGSSTTVLLSRPTPLISTSTTSPDVERPAVRRRPGEHDVAREQRDVAAEVGEQVVDAEVHLADLALLHDLAVDVRAQRRSRGRRRRATMPGPIGQKPSWPLTRSIEPASVSRKSWRPTSLAEAKPARWSHTSAGATLRIGAPTTAASSPS